MRIGLIAAPWIPVPPPNYGGTELVVDHLAGGSQREATTSGSSPFPSPPARWRSEWVLPEAAEPMGFTVPEAQHVLAAYKAFDDVDVIHDHTVLGPVLAAGHKHPDIPVVFTNHNLVTPQTRPLLHAAAARRLAGRDLARPVLSRPGRRGHRRHPPRHRPLPVPVRSRWRRVRAVHRPDEPGQGPGASDPDRPRGGHAAEDGRQDVGAGREGLLPRGRRADARPRHRAAPVGEHDEQNVEMLRHAEALVNPISWHEPFGLVMPEAMSCGHAGARVRRAAPRRRSSSTGSPAGSARTRRISRRPSTRVRDFDRAACRQLVETRFSLQRMARDHERLYRRLINAKQAATVGYAPVELLTAVARQPVREAPQGARPSERQAFFIVRRCGPRALGARGPRRLGCSGASSPGGPPRPLRRRSWPPSPPAGRARHRPRRRPSPWRATTATMPASAGDAGGSGLTTVAPTPSASAEHLRHREGEGGRPAGLQARRHQHVGPRAGGVRQPGRARLDPGGGPRRRHLAPRPRGRAAGRRPAAPPPPWSPRWPRAASSASPAGRSRSRSRCATTAKVVNTARRGRARRRRPRDAQRRRQATHPLHGHLRPRAGLDHEPLPGPGDPAARRAEHHLRRRQLDRAAAGGRRRRRDLRPRRPAQDRQRRASSSNRCDRTGPDLGGRRSARSASPAACRCTS